MSEDKPERQETDPFAPIVQFYDSWAKTWADTLSQTVASKSFADSMSQQLEGSLDALTLLRRQMSDLMEQSLQQMSLPTRNQVVNLGKRLTNIEIRMDDLDAKLDQILERLAADGEK